MTLIKRIRTRAIATCFFFFNDNNNYFKKKQHRTNKNRLYLIERRNDQTGLRDLDLGEEAALDLLRDVPVGGLDAGRAAAGAQDLTVLLRQPAVVGAPVVQVPSGRAYSLQD